MPRNIVIGARLATAALFAVALSSCETAKPTVKGTVPVARNGALSWSTLGYVNRPANVLFSEGNVYCQKAPARLNDNIENPSQPIPRPIRFVLENERMCDGTASYDQGSCRTGTWAVDCGSGLSVKGTFENRQETTVAGVGTDSKGGTVAFVLP